MKPASIEQGFGFARVQAMLGLPRSVIRSIVAAGFVAPARGPRKAYRFSFQDLLLLRTAAALRQARIAPRRMLRALARLRTQAARPLSGLCIRAVGADIALREHGGPWRAVSGQLLLDFEPDAGTAGVHCIAATGSHADLSLECFLRGEALERAGPTARPAAESAYRRAIELQPGAAAPVVNLSALLCDTRRCAEAAALCEAALVLINDEPLIHFNHAVALAGLQRLPAAMAAYGRTLMLDSRCADAHYNLAVLLRDRGDARGALRHFNAYRRLALGR